MNSKEKKWAFYDSHGEEDYPSGIVRIAGLQGDIASLEYCDGQAYPMQSRDINHLKSFDTISDAVRFYIKDNKDITLFEVVQDLSMRFSGEKDNLEEFLNFFDKK